MFNLKKLSECRYLLPKEGGMLVPGLLIASERMIEQEEFARPLEQVRNVAHLPGIVDYSIAMPDIHWGYGFPIGGVAAMDVNDGVISPGGVGYDINCGVRLAFLSIPFDELKKGRELLRAIYDEVPSGMGKGHGRSIKGKDWNAIAQEGAAWLVKHGIGLKEDLEATESHGCIPLADSDAVTHHAKDRGAEQLGSIGSGNHFVEIGYVETVYDRETAHLWDVRETETYVMIHSGSRGFGHQVCQDTLDHFLKQGFGKGLVDRQLVAAPINSPEGNRYFAAMNAAANFAFCNRQAILHGVRKGFERVLGIKGAELRQLYDVCHNIAKFEEHKGRKVLVHRKGATRAFGPGHKELADRFQKTGQPVIVPGDMGRASFLLKGLGNEELFCSCCHGAGRAKSRIQSHARWKGEDPVGYMDSLGVQVMADSIRTIDEEMPDAYKDVEEVVNACEHAKLANKVVKLKPKLVLKG